MRKTIAFAFLLSCGAQEGAPQPARVSGLVSGVQQGTPVGILAGRSWVVSPAALTMVSPDGGFSVPSQMGAVTAFVDSNNNQLWDGDEAALWCQTSANDLTWQCDFVKESIVAIRSTSVFVDRDETIETTQLFPFVFSSEWSPVEHSLCDGHGVACADDAEVIGLANKKHVKKMLTTCQHNWDAPFSAILSTPRGATDSQGPIRLRSQGLVVQSVAR